MGTIELNGKVKELRELRRMADELTAEIDAIQDAIKAEMTARDVDTITGSDYRIVWQEVTSTRMDTAALKKELPDVAERYSITTSHKRFLIA